MSTDKDGLDQALSEFRRSVEITRDVRFQANLRLSQRQRNSSFMISFLSLYVIAISLLPNIFDLKNHQSQILLACSVVLSAFVLFTSLIDGSRNFYYQGELLHKCAREVATIYLELKNIDIKEDRALAKSNLQKLQNRYRKALDDCPINHENVDFMKEQYNKPHLFENNYSKNSLIRTVQIKWRGTFSFLVSHSWMLMHIIAIISITWIIFKYVLSGALLVS
jgi:hypothetical protein